MRLRPLAPLVLALVAELCAAGAARAACTIDAQCADTNPCTVDTCSAGVCVHTANNAACDDGNLCTDDLCDTSLGCLHAENAVACNDANACTGVDVCMAGACVGGAPAAGCTPCQAAAVIPAQGGTFLGVTSGTGALSGSCGTSGPSPERVYAWTPVTSGTATISTCGSATLYDSVIYLRSGACGGTEVACNDDTAGCSTGEPNDHHGSRIQSTVTAGQTYFIVVDGFSGAAGTYALTVVAPSVCGNGVREGAEQCDGTDSTACADERCTPGCACVIPAGGLPDLVPAIADVSVSFGATVATGDVAEGCAESTSNVDLLRFSVSSINSGTADLVLGDPLCPSPCSDYPLVICGNPDFLCSPAGGHNHPHYTHYARYELLDATSQAVIVGHKQGFCLRDTNCAAPKYTCTDQGVSAGCFDVYSASLGCQYLDITGVPPGLYTLRVRMDPYGRIPELSDANNVVTVPVTLTAPATTTSTTLAASTTTTTLAGDACAAANVVPPAGGTFTGTTSGASTLSGCVSQTSTAPEKVFQWTPSVSGTATVETCGAGTGFDTVVYVRSGSCAAGTVVACNDDAAGCSTGDGCATADHHGSRVVLSVTAGQTYWLVVDGYAGSCGGASGAFTLRITPPAGATTTTTLASPTTSSTAIQTTSSTTSTSRTTTTTTATSTSTRTTSTTSSTSTSSSTTSSFTTTSSSTTTSTTSSTTTSTLADRCTSPKVVPSGGGSIDGKTGGRSDFSGSCAPTAETGERVFQWTPNRSGAAVIETCGGGTDFDTVVYVRAGDCRLGGELGCNDNACGAQSRVTLTVTAGETYYLFVDGRSGASGKFKLRVVAPL
jgi:Lysyl oxidase